MASWKGTEMCKLPTKLIRSSKAKAIITSTDLLLGGKAVSSRLSEQEWGPHFIVSSFCPEWDSSWWTLWARSQGHDPSPESAPCNHLPPLDFTFFCGTCHKLSIRFGGRMRKAKDIYCVLEKIPRWRVQLFISALLWDDWGQEVRRGLGEPVGDTRKLNSQLKENKAKQHIKC